MKIKSKGDFSFVCGH